MIPSDQKDPLGTLKCFLSPSGVDSSVLHKLVRIHFASCSVSQTSRLAGVHAPVPPKSRGLSASRARFSFPPFPVARSPSYFLGANGADAAHAPAVHTCECGELPSPAFQVAGAP